MIVERKEHKENDNNVGYIECVFESENILKTTYFPNIQRLYIAFSRGHTYSYGNVSLEKYKEFEEADSQGKFFHQQINNKTKYPVRKEFTLYPNEINDLKIIIENNKLDNDDDE